MPTDHLSPAPNSSAGDQRDPNLDSSLELLRQILLREQEARIEGLEAELVHLEHRVSDERSLIKLIAPVLGEAIRLKIREARDEMIDALYPIIGQVVQRAVKESVSDLARSLDAQARRTFDLRLAWWRFRARVSGATEAQIRLRELLPFSVADVLLIHRETGLLLYHLPGDISATSDTDLFSGMLTAIRDFSQNTLGGDGQDELGEITYGDQRILIETGRYTYLAVIVNGNPMPGFREEMRVCIIKIEDSLAEELHCYQGDAGTFVSAKDTLQSLTATSAPKKLSTSQKRILGAGFASLIVFLGGCVLLTSWLWRASHPILPAVVIPPTNTVTVSPTLSPTPTSTSQPTNIPTLTLTPVPSATPTNLPAPVLGVTLGNVWMRTGPSIDAALSGVVLTLGENVELLAVYGDWVRVRQSAGDQFVADGWIPVRWFGFTGSFPPHLITPTAVP